MSGATPVAIVASLPRGKSVNPTVGHNIVSEEEKVKHDEKKSRNGSGTTMVTTVASEPLPVPTLHSASCGITVTGLTWTPTVAHTATTTVVAVVHTVHINIKRKTKQDPTPNKIKIVVNGNLARCRPATPHTHTT